MGSSLTWLDHDSAARQRSLRILSLFDEKESRDELGIGAIRDKIAERLFPGTSTIQTRLRYMLMIPWIYQRLEMQKVPAAQFAVRARRDEIALIQPLMNAREQGVYGSSAGSSLKRLPSSVYWGGLGRWKIRMYEGSQSNYHQHIDQIYETRALHRKSDERFEDDSRPTTTWNPKLPKAPEDFPSHIDLTLTSEEGQFLMERMLQIRSGSLLEWLVSNGMPDECEEPWQHHQFNNFPKSVRTLLTHAKCFTDIMEGAARLYNHSLATLRENTDLQETHEEALRDWRHRVDLDSLANWDLDEFEADFDLSRKTLSEVKMMNFIREWHRLILESKGKVLKNRPACQLVEQREIEVKKGARSRFMNKGALALWTGNAGTGRLVYRWPTARQFLSDLYPAIGRG